MDSASFGVPEKIGPYGPYREGPMSPKPNPNYAQGFGATFGRRFLNHFSEIRKVINNQKTKKSKSWFYCTANSDYHNGIVFSANQCSGVILKFYFTKVQTSWKLTICLIKKVHRPQCIFCGPQRSPLPLPPPLLGPYSLRAIEGFIKHQ